jgi:hypothetical protein
MYTVKAPSTSAFRHIILISVIGLLTPSGTLWGDCTQNYPDSDVTAQLSKADYTHCSMAVMVADYAKLLQDKQRLLTALRPVYNRKLDKEVVGERLSKAELTVRLNDYDANLMALLTMKDSMVSWAASISDSADGDSVGKISQEMKNTLSRHLTKSKKSSQALKRKINRARDELTNVEWAEFCKLDFYLRVGEGLNPKISACLKATN